MSSFFAGAEIITFFTGPRMCFFASFASVKCPVDSITTCAPTDSQGSAPGSLSLNTFMVLLSIVMLSAPALILFGRLPRMESYFRRCASVFGSVRSLTATNSRLGSLSEVRSTLRPMRPKPLMPTLIAMVSPFLSSYECDLRKLPEPVHRQMMLAGQGSGVNDRYLDLEGSGSHTGVRCFWLLTARLREAYFQERICFAPGRRQSGQQILPIDSLPSVTLLFRRQ